MNRGTAAGPFARSLARRWAAVCLGAVTWLFAASASAAPGVRRALIIAHNGSDDSLLAPLRFADDDGVLWAETLQRLGVETTLLVDPDEPTRQAHHPVLDESRPPTPEEVDRAVAGLRAAHRADRQAGHETDLLLIYIGHGNVDPAGHAYLTLAGGRLDHTAFYGRVVDRLEADHVHVIVDACHAAGVVGGSRLAGAEGSARARVGAIWAESEDGATHEWSRLQAGVFSHVMRSGLLGAADINADGVVEYSELSAFATAAFKGMQGLPSNLSVRTSAPAHAPHHPLVGLPPPGPVLTLPSSFEHERISVEDAEGRRLMDLRRARGQQVEVSLPEREVYWVRTPTLEARVEASHLETGELPLLPREFLERGPLEEGLRRGLFAIPFDRSFYEGYMAETGWAPVDFSPSSPSSRLPVRARRQVNPGRGWHVGLDTLRAPLELEGFAAGPSVAWHSTPSPLYSGLRASYALTPIAREGVRAHQLTLQALAGVELPGVSAPFLEAAAGWALLGAMSSGHLYGDPLAFSGRVSLGIRVRPAFGWVRLAGVVGVNSVTQDGARHWEPTYGVAWTWQR